VVVPANEGGSCRVGRDRVGKHCRRASCVVPLRRVRPGRRPRRVSGRHHCARAGRLQMAVPATRGPVLVRPARHFGRRSPRGADVRCGRARDRTADHDHHRHIAIVCDGIGKKLLGDVSSTYKVAPAENGSRMPVFVLGRPWASAGATSASGRSSSNERSRTARRRARRRGQPGPCGWSSPLSRSWRSCGCGTAARMMTSSSFRHTTASYGTRTTGATGAGASSSLPPSGRGSAASGRTTYGIRSCPSSLRRSFDR
jgi:hypothetical protein